MASGHEKHDCGVDPNFGWAGDPNAPIPMKVRIIDGCLLTFAFTVGSITILGKLAFLWE